MSVFVIGPFVVSWLTLFFGVFVYLKNRKAKLNKVFSLICLSVFIWAFGYSQMYNTKSGDAAALFWARFGYSGAVFIPVFVWHYIMIFLGVKVKKWIMFGAYLLGVLFFIISRTDLFLYSMQRSYFWGYYPKAGPIYIFFVLFFALVFISAVAVLYYHLKFKKIGLSSNDVNRIKYLLAGFAIASTSIVDYLPNYGVEIYPWGYLSAFGWLICMWWATFKYRLMDITVALTRATIFIIVYTLVLGIPFALAILFRLWLSSFLGVNWWMAPLGLMAIFATAGPFIYIYLNKRAEEELLKEQRRYQDTLKRASLGMTRVRDISKLLKLIVHTVARAVRLNHAAIYILNKEADGYILGSSRGNLSPAQTQTISLNTPLIQHLLGSKGPLLQEELAYNPASQEREPRPEAPSGRGEYQNNLLKAQLYTLSASVVIPSFIEDDLLGFMVLGEKRSGSIYTEDDLRVFTVLASQAGLAIENARFFESAKETQEQISQAEKMATLGTMADGLSHQMNNRFHAMSLIASDALDCIKSSDNKNASPEIKELLSYLEHSAQRIKSNSLQGGDIVRGMLKYTRKGETGFAGVNLDELLNATLEMLQFKIKLNEIDIERNYPKEETNLKANFTQLQEVFFNLIDNAYDAMNERKAALKEPGYRGKVKIVAISDPANHVTKIIVHDNGLGIKEEDQKKVFTPFFTTKISNRKGTGLGLYVIKKIITENHKGRIHVSSVYKQGTTFSLELATADTAEHASNAPSKGNIEIWGE